jgi:hypothetical protein
MITAVSWPIRNRNEIDFRVTRCFCEKIAQWQQKIAQKVAQPFVC